MLSIKGDLLFCTDSILEIQAGLNRFFQGSNYRAKGDQTETLRVVLDLSVKSEAFTGPASPKSYLRRSI